MTPTSRFTFFHDTVSPSGTVVNQPIGWKNIVLSLTRDPAFHSLIEYFKGGFIWYGAARDFLIDCETASGPEAKIRVLIEIRFKSTWSTIFDGLIDVSQKEELSMANTFYKYAAPIIRNDFWATFMNRRTTKVDLEAAVDLEGNARTAINKIVLPLPTQKIQQNHESYLEYSIGWTGVNTGDYMQFGFTDIRVSEIKDITTLVTGAGSALPAFLLIAREMGDYDFDIRVEESLFTPASTFAAIGSEIAMYIKVNNEAAVALTKTDFSTYSTFTYTSTLSLNVGDEVRVYAIFGSDSWEGGGKKLITWGTNDAIVGSPIGFSSPSGNTNPSHFIVDANTTFVDTETDAYLIKDAFESVLSKIIGQDSVISSTMFTTCKRLNAIFRGLHGRGYSFTDRPFTTSFDELWKGFEPVANIGLGYDEVAGVKKIVIEDKSFFYGKTPSVFLSNISGLTRRYDLEKHYKTVEVGYSKRFIESAGGVDDPQTLASWRTKFRTIGNDIKIISTFFLASLGIEQNRRNRVEFSKDGKIDEDIIMVAVKEDGSDYTPEIGTDFNAVTGLLNSNTRYNIRHVCARVFKRWQSFLQGCLQHTTSEYFYYSGGEGNRTMTSQLETTDCEATDDPEPVLTENADIAVSTTDYLFIPKVFKCKAPMSKVTYDAILTDKENAIAISQGTSGYLPMHILDFDYKIFGGYADLTLLQASVDTVEPSGDAILMEDGNFILMEDGSSNILLE